MDARFTGQTVLEMHAVKGEPEHVEYFSIATPGPLAEKTGVISSA
jgi:hypothetical protein